MYQMIFKRKSFRRFDNRLLLDAQALADIREKLDELTPLVGGIRVVYRLVPVSVTTCKRGAYALLVYSEIAPFYLENVGFLVEQLDLWLASKDIGACWYGMGKPDVQTYDGLDHVIMLAIGKAAPEAFRKDYTKAKRQPVAAFWTGAPMAGVTDCVRYAPSACNTQPWRVVSEKEGLRVFRATGSRCLIPKDKVPFYNRIDMGIFLYFMTCALTHEGHRYERTLKLGEARPDGCVALAYFKWV